MIESLWQLVASSLAVSIITAERLKIAGRRLGSKRFTRAQVEGAVPSPMSVDRHVTTLD